MSRERVENIIYERMSEIDPSGTNTNIYKELFKNMSNSDFEEMMISIRDGKAGTFIIAPNNYPDVKLDLNRNKKLLKKHNIPLFKKLVITNGKESYIPDIEFMVLEMPIARMAQTLDKSFSVHAHLKSRNTITGQVTNDSKSGELSLNEINILKSLNLKDSLNELVGIRGGNIKSSNILRAKLFNEGVVTLDYLKSFSGKRGATKSLKDFFKAIHIDISI